MTAEQKRVAALLDQSLSLPFTQPDFAEMDDGSVKMVYGALTYVIMPNGKIEVSHA